MPGLLSAYRFTPPSTLDGGFVGYSQYGNLPAATKSVAISLPSGTAADDFVMVAIYRSVTGPAVTGSSGWTTATTTLGTFKVSYIYKRVDAADLSASLSAANDIGTGGFWAADVCVWRGPSTLAIRNEASSPTGTTLVFSGFTKDAKCFALVGNYIERDMTAPTWPANWDVRVPVSQIVASVFLSEVRQQNPADYTNGATITVSNFSNVTIQSGSILELMTP
jgi:hypothetical protein